MENFNSRIEEINDGFDAVAPQWVKKGEYTVTLSNYNGYKTEIISALQNLDLSKPVYIKAYNVGQFSSTVTSTKNEASCFIDICNVYDHTDQTSRYRALWHIIYPYVESTYSFSETNTSYCECFPLGGTATWGTPLTQTWRSASGPGSTVKFTNDFKIQIYCGNCSCTGSVKVEFYQ